jgi:transposase
VTLQVVRDWALKFNSRGPDGLIDRKAPGQPPRLNEAHRAALAVMIESGPIPAVHGVVRWRIVDLRQWIFEEFRIAISQQTLSRALRKMGYRKRARRDLCGDFGEMQGHRLGVAARHDEGRALAVFRADRSENIGRSACRASCRSSGMASFRQTAPPVQHHLDPAAGQMPRTEPAGKHLAVHARQLAVESDLRFLRPNRRPLLRTWNKLIDQPWRIMSIGIRKWAYAS